MNRFLPFALMLLVAADWPQFRGPDAQTASRDTGLPVKFGPSENIAWTAALPGRGLSSPVISRGAVYVTANTGMNQTRLHVLSFDATTGAKRWERQFWATGQTLCHPDTSMAAPTMVADDHAVYALFASNDLVALTHAGDVLWVRALSVEYPKMTNHVGRAASPVLAGGTLAVAIENQGESFLFGFDAKTGQTRWQPGRPTDNCWTTPVAITRDGRAEIVAHNGEGVTAFDAVTGSLMWSQTGEGWGASAASITPVGDGRLLIPASGGLTMLTPGPEPKQAWRAKVRLQYASAAVAEGRVFALTQTLLTCTNLADGKLLWDTRLKGKSWATPLVADGKVYRCAEEGIITVYDATANEAKLLATNEFPNERFQATPAVVDGALYLRTDGFLRCVRARP